MVKEVIAATSIRWAGSFLAFALSFSSAAEVPSDHAVDAAIAWISRSEPGKNPPAGSVDTSAGFTDNVDRSDPNFVKASLLWIGPGNEFFGCAGHSSIRLECPKFNLDYCFSCESESIRDNPFRFLMGDLKTGMFAIPTAVFLKTYEQLGRSVTQYPLTLPPDVKQRLWKILDEAVAAGRCLPYDYIKYCCVQTMIQPLLRAIPPYTLKPAPWPDVYKLTRREVLSDDLEWCPWTRLFLHTIAGTEVDREVSPMETVILSRDFVNLLKGAMIGGRHVIEGDGEVLLSFQKPTGTTVVTPVMVAFALVVFSAANLILVRRFMDWLFLAIQSVLGLLLSHLVFLSHLPATDWNWLIVPFNLLPLVFWKWRQKWALWFAGVLVLWEIGMIAYPHRLTDPAYLVLVGAYIVFYLKFTRFGKNVLNRVHYGMATCKGFLQVQTGDNP